MPSNPHIKHCPTKAVDYCLNSMLWAQSYNHWQYAEFAPLIFTVSNEKLLSSILFSKRIASAVWFSDALTELLSSESNVSVLFFPPQTTMFKTKTFV